MVYSMVRKPWLREGEQFSLLGRFIWGAGAGLREMEGRVDKNNRSLLANPFVSMVLIHPSKPPPHPQPFPTGKNRCWCSGWLGGNKMTFFTHMEASLRGEIDQVLLKIYDRKGVEVG